MWYYEQKTGRMYRVFENSVGGETTTVAFLGYSGGGIDTRISPQVAKNNPDYQDVHNEGPIPQGLWHMTGLTLGQTPHGPYVIHLTPDSATGTFGRSGFLIHGDSIKTPGYASEGCIILPRGSRESVWVSNDHDLTVISGEETSGAKESSSN